MADIYLKGEVYRNIGGERVCLGGFVHTFNADPFRVVNYVEKFMDHAANAISATLRQATAVCALEPVEFRLVMGCFHQCSRSYSVENPATRLGIDSHDIVTGLSAKDADRLEDEIVQTAATVKEKMLTEVFAIFVRDILTALKR